VEKKSCILFETTAKADMLGSSCLMSSETSSVETQSGMNAHPCVLSASEILRLLLPSSQTALQERKLCSSETHHPALPTPQGRQGGILLLLFYACRSTLYFTLITIPITFINDMLLIYLLKLF
jgi:hypothetical protein